MASLRGINYDVLCDGYGEAYRRDQNQLVVLIKCAWADVPDLKREILGYTEVGRGGGTPRLRRTLPLLCPSTATKYAMSMDLVEYGGDLSQVAAADEPAELSPMAEFLTTGGGKLLSPPHLPDGGREPGREPGPKGLVEYGRLDLQSHVCKTAVAGDGD